MVKRSSACIVAILLSHVASADDGLNLAVASNFHNTAVAIAADFTEKTGTEVRISTGSSGKLYAQIVNGAPYDVFLAADSERPRRLEEEGLAVDGSRITYAFGSLVLWSADESLQGESCFGALQKGGYRHLAIANPRLAPYGAAAVEFLRSANLYEAASARLVLGDSVSQALHFVGSGNATLGLIAASQVVSGLPVAATCFWNVPTDMHSPIAQQAVLLRDARSPEAGLRFLKFLQQEGAVVLLNNHGYRTPE